MTRAAQSKHSPARVTEILLLLQSQAAFKRSTSPHVILGTIDANKLFTSHKQSIHSFTPEQSLTIFVCVEESKISDTIRGLTLNSNKINTRAYK